MPKRKPKKLRGAHPKNRHNWEPLVGDFFPTKEELYRAFKDRLGEKVARKRAASWERTFQSVREEMETA